MGVLPHPDRATEFLPVDSLQIDEKGTISLTAHKGEFTQSAVVHPGGVESRTFTSRFMPNYKFEFSGLPDGSWKDNVCFPNGTQMNVTYGPFEKAKPNIKSVTLTGGGGWLSITNRKDTAAWIAKSPSGEITKGSMPEDRLDEIADLSRGNRNLSIDWYTGKNHESPYDIVIDKSGISDWLKREMKHAKDQF